MHNGHGSGSSTSSTSTRAAAPPGRSSTGHHSVNQGRSGNLPGGGKPNQPDPNRFRVERELDNLIKSASTPYGGYRTAGEQAAASWKAAGMVSGSGLSGEGLWNKLPVGYAQDLARRGGDPTLYNNEYYSTYGKGAQAYSPTGIISISGEGGVPAYKGRDKITGELIPWDQDDWQYEVANKYKIVNPYYGGQGGGGGGYGPPEKFTPRGNQNELWGQQNPLQQMMINIHGGQGFQQGFRRGGIVSLVE